jgi:hypothetical protein
LPNDDPAALVSCRAVVADDASGVDQYAVDLLYALFAQPQLAEENPLLADNNLTPGTGRRQMGQMVIAIPWEERKRSLAADVAK